MTSKFSSRPAFSADLELAALPVAVSDARRFAETWLRKWCLEELTDTTVLIVSELITNSIKATGLAGTPHEETQRGIRRSAMVILRLRLSEVSLVVEVEDEDPRPPVVRDVGDLDEDGRGLVLVAALSKAWGHHPMSGGKKVWAEVHIPADQLSERAHAELMALPQRVASRRAAHPIKSLTGLDTLRRIRDALRDLVDFVSAHRGRGSYEIEYQTLRPASMRSFYTYAYYHQSHD